MKKLLLTTAILFSTLGANAINWQPLNVTTPNIDVYVDTDTIKTLNNNEYYYTIKYQAFGQSEKIAYIKANSKTKNIGIIQAGEYDPDRYRPNAVFDNPHVMMKPVKQDSFLYYANEIVAAIALGNTMASDNLQTIPYRRLQNGDEVLVSYIGSVRAQDVMTATALDVYLAQTSQILKENWKPSISGAGTKTTVKATIGTDGSLINHKIIESSGNDTNDRSVIAALERSVKFPQIKTADPNNYAVDFQFIFVNDMFKKSVIY